MFVPKESDISFNEYLSLLNHNTENHNSFRADVIYETYEEHINSEELKGVYSGYEFKPKAKEETFIKSWCYKEYDKMLKT